MLTKVYAAALQGIDATLITIEVNSLKGCSFSLVGLPDSAVRESQQRVFTAFNVLGINIPVSDILVNMAPADIRKEGSAYDLPLSLGILTSTGILPHQLLDDYMLMGEMGLDGRLMPIRGALPIAIMARELGFKGIILPHENAREAAVVNNLIVLGAENLSQVVEFFNGNEKSISPTIINTREDFYSHQDEFETDFSDV
ncbi:MAG: magnesium chelatase, partial [Bacteroidaceae bacterium]|nr:magnesium chelatase [Bacteroidaceae bacterium]